MFRFAQFATGRIRRGGHDNAHMCGEILERLCGGRMEEVRDMTRGAQRKALARRFAPGLLRPFSGMNVSVRLGEIAQTILSRWPIRPQRARPIANFGYLAVMRSRALADVAGKSLFVTPVMAFVTEVTVVSDGSWTCE